MDISSVISILTILELKGLVKELSARTLQLARKYGGVILAKNLVIVESPAKSKQLEKF